jgi:hypothetical protein
VESHSPGDRLAQSTAADVHDSDAVHATASMRAAVNIAAWYPGGPRDIQ